MLSKTELFVLALGAALIVLILAAGIDRCTAKHVSVGPGVVAHKVYKPATHSSHVETRVIDTKGNTMPVVIHDDEPERWIIIVKHEGDTFSQKVDSNTWGNLELGGEVEVIEISGFINWGKRVVFHDPQP